MIRTITTIPAAVLRNVAKRVTPKRLNSQIFQALISDMKTTVLNAKGWGLAAPQVNEPYRLFVMCYDGLYTFINPTILGFNDELFPAREGCLSIPDHEHMVSRWTSVTLRWTNPNGIKSRATFTGVVARIIQHEIDHLNGKLITDYYVEGSTDVRNLDTHRDGVGDGEIREAETRQSGAPIQP